MTLLIFIPRRMTNLKISWHCQEMKITVIREDIYDNDSIKDRWWRIPSEADTEHSKKKISRENEVLLLTLKRKWHWQRSPHQTAEGHPTFPQHQQILQGCQVHLLHSPESWNQQANVLLNRSGNFFHSASSINHRRNAIGKNINKKERTRTRKRKERRISKNF